MRFESFVDFDTAKTGEYIHTMESAIACMNDPRVIDIAWLDQVDENNPEEDIRINVVYEEDDEDTSEGDFNIIIPFDVFDKEKMVDWMKNNRDRVWNGNNPGDKIRGIDYV